MASLFGWTPVASAFHSNALHDGHETISHLSHGLRILVRLVFGPSEVGAVRLVLELFDEDADVDAGAVNLAVLVCLRIDSRSCLAIRDDTA